MKSEGVAEGMNINCDIDGTLTHDGTKAWGEPNLENIAAIREAAANGHTVVLWSATGEAYAKEFAKKHKINARACLAKPDICFDDIETIRPPEFMVILPPDEIGNWVNDHGVPREAK